MWGITVRLDVTRLRRLCKSQQWSYFIASYYLVGYTANEYEPMRYRIRKDNEQSRLIEHHQISVSATILLPDETYGFFCLEMLPHEPFVKFMERTKIDLDGFRQTAKAMDGKQPRDDVLHGTTLPWIDFTSFEHAMGDWINYSIPKFVFGKLVSDDKGAWTQSFCLHVHHGLMDGLHAGQYLEKLRANFDNCEAILGVKEA